MKITIRSIIRVEQLLGQPFGTLDFDNTEHLIPFFYCLLLCHSGEQITFEEFKELLTDKRLAQFIKSFKKSSDLLAQFQSFKELEKDGEPAFVKDTIMSLIVSGIDADFVYNQVELQDIPLLFEALNEKNKQEMESRRLWTYLSMLPHIDGKKIKSPKDLYPFPWEKEADENQALNDLEANKEIFEKFFNGEIKL